MLYSPLMMAAKGNKVNMKSIVMKKDQKENEK